MLIMTWVATLIQMKNHPIISAMISNTKSYHTIWVRQNNYHLKHLKNHKFLHHSFLKSIYSILNIIVIWYREND